MSNNKQIDQIKKELLISLVEQIPFCKTLGIKLDCLGNEITAHLPFKKDFIGNPAIPALHGGIIGSFLEITAIIQLSWAIVLERKDDQIKLKKSSLESRNIQFGGSVTRSDPRSVPFDPSHPVSIEEFHEGQS